MNERHYQDVNVLYVQVSLMLYVKRKRVDVQSMSSGSTLCSCVYVVKRVGILVEKQAEFNGL